jgi:8-oxo-dGTP pyrophosphatase MutT (NUDIX family)
LIDTPRSVTKPKARIEHSSGGVVARHMDGTVHVLLIRDPNGKWGLPKGHVENGESSREAALREVREETGLTNIDAGPSLGTIDWYFKFKGDLVHKFCDYFLMASPNGDTTPKVSEGITKCLWLPVKEAIVTVAYDNAREVVVRAADVLNSGEADALL